MARVARSVTGNPSLRRGHPGSALASLRFGPGYEPGYEAVRGVASRHMPRHTICRIIRRGWVLSFAGCEPEQWRSAMKVKDVMHKGVDWVDPDTPVVELARLMRRA